MIKEPTVKHGGLSSIYVVEEENQPTQTNLWPPYAMVLRSSLPPSSLSPSFPPSSLRLSYTHTNKCKRVLFPHSLWQCPHHKAQAMRSCSCFSISQRDNLGAY